MKDEIEKIMKTTHYGYAHAKEIKEILDSIDDWFEIEGHIPDEVLISISDLTACALNYYKSIESVKCRQKIIINHIINQQNTIDYLEDIVENTELSDEIKKADEMSKRTLYKSFGKYKTLIEDEMVAETKVDNS